MGFASFLPLQHPQPSTPVPAPRSAGTRGQRAHLEGMAGKAQPQLPAHHHGLHRAPVLAAHRAPPQGPVALGQHLHPALVGVAAAAQPQLQGTAEHNENQHSSGGRGSSWGFSRPQNRASGSHHNRDGHQRYWLAVIAAKVVLPPFISLCRVWRSSKRGTKSEHHPRLPSWPIQCNVNITA